MQFECPQCHAVLDFADKRPSFCAFCGHALSGSRPTHSPAVGADTPPAQRPPRPSGASTALFDPEGATLLPPAASPGTADDGAPEVVGGYCLLRPLGEGGMGTVYEAEEPATGRRVALKLIPPDVATPDAVERFRQEGRLASQVVHPRCVFVLAADEDAGRPYIVMELMPGRTLEDLVREEGPLPPAEAVAKILDVIDGLREVHRLGIVHRDVKPSNCFLDADGGVKVGDFGLSKALVGDTRLTKTGSFLGTPLYASPEQVRAERLDGRTDVYSAAATLYFCLTGRAPHQTGDAAATLARIASDPAPSLRAVRPEVPAALDAVVLRGLERDRQRRWQSLDAFRAALAPFVPSQLTPAGPSLRAAAYMVDFLLFCAIPHLIHSLTMPVVTLAELAWRRLLHELLTDLLWFFCFAVLEGCWGCSPGKYLLRLRVCTPESGNPPGVGRALLRSAVFFVFTSLGSTMVVFVPYVAFDSEHLLDWYKVRDYLQILAYASSGAGLGVLASSMRARNGYRGLHELVSGTRVVQLPWNARRRPWRQPPLEDAAPLPGGLPQRLGPFKVLGAVRGTPEEPVLLAEEPVLDRRVWLWLRPREAQLLAAARRELGRPTRLRWLAAGQEGDWQWDAFLAPPSGCPLPLLMIAEKQLPWSEVRPLLEQLAEELIAACQDGTLPQPLTAGQVWLQADGRLVLLDTPLDGSATVPEIPTSTAASRQALALLHDVATLALEGRLPTPGEPARRPRVPVPVHAAQVLDRLAGRTKPYPGINAFQAEFRASGSRPTQVTRGLRSGQVALQAGLLFAPFMLFFMLASVLMRTGILESPPDLSPLSGWVVGLACAGVGAVWAFLFRGGWALRWAGLVVVRRDGLLASRLRCAWRALLVWLPVAAWFSWVPDNSFIEVYGTLALLLSYVGLALLFPRRGLQDLLAGTCLVPR
jgi:hypothetical protein